MFVNSDQGLCAPHAPITAQRPVPTDGGALVRQRQCYGPCHEDTHAYCSALHAASDPADYSSALLCPWPVHRDVDGKH